MTKRPGRPNGKIPTDPETGSLLSCYSDELARSICDHLSGAATGKAMSLRAVCRMDGMPDRSTVVAWQLDKPEFYEMVTRARNIGLDDMADEIIDIVDDTEDVPFLYDEKGNMLMGADKRPLRPARDASLVRLRYDARRWYLSKMAPKRYGEKITQEHTGPDGVPLPAAAPPQFIIEGVKPVHPEEHDGSDSAEAPGS